MSDPTGQDSPEGTAPGESGHVTADEWRAMWESWTRHVRARRYGPRRVTAGPVKLDLHDTGVTLTLAGRRGVAIVLAGDLTSDYGPGVGDALADLWDAGWTGYGWQLPGPGRLRCVGAPPGTKVLMVEIGEPAGPRWRRWRRTEVVVMLQQGNGPHVLHAWAMWRWSAHRVRWALAAQRAALEVGHRAKVAEPPESG